MIGNKKKKF